MREVSLQAAEQRVAVLASLPIQIVGVGDDLVPAKQAAVFKATKLYIVSIPSSAAVVCGAAKSWPAPNNVVDEPTAIGANDTNVDSLII